MTPALGLDETICDSSRYVDYAVSRSQSPRSERDVPRDVEAELGGKK